MGDILTYAPIAGTLVDLSRAENGTDVLIALLDVVPVNKYSKKAVNGISQIKEALRKGDVKKAKEIGDNLKKEVGQGGYNTADKTGVSTTAPNKVSTGINPNIKTANIDTLPDNAKNIFSKYEKNGWKGNVSGQTLGTRAGQVE